tara:strand:+ start:41 stop:1072 length:1032 start_codon:yes stop_codon:yes gene_type:complete
MNYLIFRTDRIGDFLIIRSLIKAIKQNNEKNKIYIVASKKNYDFIKDTNLIDKVFLYTNGIKNRFLLFKQLKIIKFDHIIISDKKNRSIIFAILLKCKNKVFNTSKNFIYFLLKIFYKNVFLDNDNIVDKNLFSLLNHNFKSLGINSDKNYNMLFPNDFFSKYYFKKKLPVLSKNNYIVLHMDEKWELENYSKEFEKAKNFTDISPNITDFYEFLTSIIQKTNMNIIITTGKIKTKIIEELKLKMSDKEKGYYEKIILNNSCILIDNLDFLSTAEIISKSKIFICCHGAFLHIAANYNIHMIDIFEKSKKDHYLKITNSIKNYTYVYRENFHLMSKDIIKALN